VSLNKQLLELLKDKDKAGKVQVQLKNHDTFKFTFVVVGLDRSKGEVRNSFDYFYTCGPDDKTIMEKFKEQCRPVIKLIKEDGGICLIINMISEKVMMI
jgi:hypothetical protein